MQRSLRGCGSCRIKRTGCAKACRGSNCRSGGTESAVGERTKGLIYIFAFTKIFVLSIMLLHAVELNPLRYKPLLQDVSKQVAREHRSSMELSGSIRAISAQSAQLKLTESHLKLVNASFSLAHSRLFRSSSPFICSTLPIFNALASC